MGGRAIMPDVVEYLSGRANEPVTLAQLATAVHAEPVRIQKALSNAISSGVYGGALDCVHRGQVWVWRGDGHASAVPPAPLPQRVTVAPVPPESIAPVTPQGLKKGDMVEVMGTTQNSEAVASDENGRLYRVVPL
jgi:hypothetical protein